MPVFRNLPLVEAAEAVGSSERPRQDDEYLKHIQGLPAGEACCIELGDGENLRHVRMRLGAAARKAGRKIIIRRSGEKLYFWVDDRSLEKVEHSGG